MISENRMKTKLKEGRSVFGTWSMLGSPSVMNVIAASSVDFIVIDMEHGPMSFETAEMQIYAAEAGGCTPVIRLPDGDESSILHALEIGAQALMISHVATPDEAEFIVRCVKYAPEGCRGLSPFTRNHGYSDANLAAKLRHANEEMFVGVLVEGPEGLRNLDKIAKTPGLDMVYVGVYDISISAGVPGELMHPKVLEIVRDSVRVIKAAGRVPGSVARDREYLAFLVEQGFRFVSFGVDCLILRDGFETARRWFDELDSLGKR